MNKSLITLAVDALCTALSTVTGWHTQDISFGFRMGAGFAGDVNRTHPASIVAGAMNTSVQPPRLFGDPVIIDSATSSYRGITTADTSTFACDGFVVRPYPVQQSDAYGMTATIGNGAPAVNQPVDICSDGFIIVKCNVGTPTKGGAVYVYTAASTGSHVQGGLEAAAGSNLTLISNAFFNGPADASGITELRTTASKI